MVPSLCRSLTGLLKKRSVQMQWMEICAEPYLHIHEEGLLVLFAFNMPSAVKISPLGPANAKAQ